MRLARATASWATSATVACRAVCATREVRVHQEGPAPAGLSLAIARWMPSCAPPASTAGKRVEWDGLAVRPRYKFNPLPRKPRRNVRDVWRDRAWPVKRDAGDQVPAVGPVDRLADAEARRVGGHQRAGRGDGDPELGAEQIQHADLRAVRHCPARTIPGRAWPRRGRLCPGRGLLVLPPWSSLCCPGG